mmetsp:Transcript_7856/g.18930  ORF Transcript_7856/g.18930 Transcript_7856/m.18930 type:complete len:486 (-) Transcript_7856:199-1656(-)
MKAKNTSSGGNAQSFFTTHPRVCGVLLAGTKGSRLYPMTSADMPKHLLPVAGFPSILRLIQSLGNFPELVIAVNHQDNLTLDTLVKEACTLKEKTEDLWTLEYKETKQKITLLKLSEDCFGSADALRQVEAKNIVHPKTRVVVIPGDLVILKRDLNLDAIVRPSNDSACTTLLVDVGEVDEHGVPLKESAKAKKGGLGREEEDIEYIGLSYPKVKTSSLSPPVLPRIVLKESKLDVEADEDMTGSTAKLDLPKPRVHKGKLVIRTEWSDAHVYSLAPWVRELLVERKSISSIQSGLLPLLVSRQFRGKKATFGSSLPDENDENKDKQNSEAFSEEPYSVSALVLESKTVMRINNIPAYIYACKETVANGSELPMPADSRWNGKFLSLVLKESTLGAKVNMKSSIVGTKCQLGSKCRLNNVIIMDNVVIGENCSLQSTILGSGVVLGNNCSLNDCQVGPGMNLPAGTKEKGESFMVGDNIGVDDML